MNKKELEKQFRVTLFETSILITTQSNRKKAFEAKIIYPDGKAMKLLDRYGNKYDWIDTKENELNYYECCGILILFGVTPPTFIELSDILKN